jgi:hypothetical protein
MVGPGLALGWDWAVMVRTDLKPLGFTMLLHAGLGAGDAEPRRLGGSRSYKKLLPADKFGV